MVDGLRTVIYPAPDLPAARRWYAEVFRQDSYFDQPFYVGFNVSGYELGLMPDAPQAAAGADGVQAYWGVAAAAAVARLLSLGAAMRSPVTEVGEGIRVATVLDPFGNLLGIIENPHFALPEK